MLDDPATNEEFEANCRDAEKYLQRFKGETLGHFIAGKTAAGQGSKTFENVTPIDNSPLNTVSAGTAADIDTAAKAAKEAFPEWPGMASCMVRSFSM